ncbi:MAG: hypothetical protein ACJ76Y_31775 [Thermoanaerobaculia bacterium]
MMAGAFVTLVSPCAGSGPYLAERFSLDAFVVFRQGPIVHSFAEVVLYDANNQRIYNTQVILGHQVANENTQSLIFNSMVVTEIGLANSTTGDLPGEYGGCYSARMAGHANAYNLHVLDLAGPRCIPDLPPKPEPPPDASCPIILDLDQNGFHLSGTGDPVSFDIDADGIPDHIAWTGRGEDDAFLCLDRNHNGKVDDGGELFGYATPLSSGEPAQVGYRALAELDDPAAGGNGNGKIDAADRIFHDLCVWIDRNHDGASQAGELYTLDQAGIVALGYNYKTIRLTDGFGNLFRYVSQAEMRGSTGRVTSWPTFDVVFAEK